MGDRWVINASPIILLGKAEVIQLLPKLCTELVIPEGVVDEVENTRISDNGKFWLGDAGKDFVRKVSAIHAALSD